VHKAHIIIWEAHGFVNKNEYYNGIF